MRPTLNREEPQLPRVMVTKGAPLTLIKALMRHQEIKTTMGYLHTDGKHLRGATDTLLKGRSG